MKVEIINKAMLCWDDDESKAREFHVLAKVTECNTEYPFKVICNENTYPDNPEYAKPGGNGAGGGFKNAKPLPLIKPRTIEDGLEEGDIIIMNNKDTAVILGICGKVVFRSIRNDHDVVHRTPCTLEELIYGNWELLQENQPKEIVELTIQDISEGKGKGIDPSLIRIKE